jgi:hypothetical protein
MQPASDLRAVATHINIHETALAVTVSAEVRDEGHPTWSCHGGQLQVDLATLQAMLAALGHADRISGAQQMTIELLDGALETATLLYESDDDKRVLIEMSLAGPAQTDLDIAAACALGHVWQTKAISGEDELEIPDCPVCERPFESFEKIS